MDANEYVAENGERTPAETLEQVAARTGMTVEQLAELTPEQLEEVAGGGDWLQTLVDQWKEIKHGIVEGWNGGLTG